MLRCEYPGNPIGCLQQHHNKVTKSEGGVSTVAAVARAVDAVVDAMASADSAAEQDLNPQPPEEERQMYSLNSEAGNNSDEGMGEELAQDQAEQQINSESGKLRDCSCHFRGYQ